jgi:hypothetical protein
VLGRGHALRPRGRALAQRAMAVLAPQLGHEAPPDHAQPAPEPLAVGRGRRAPQRAQPRLLHQVISRVRVDAAPADVASQAARELAQVVLVDRVETAVLSFDHVFEAPTRG